MSSNPALNLRTSITGALALAIIAHFAVNGGALAAQDDSAITPEAQEQETAPTAETQPDEMATDTGDQEEDEEPRPINLSVTVPSGEVNEAQVQECVDRADAGEISGEIIVCRRLGDSGENNFSNREEARKRYAEETAFSGSPRTPDVFGIADNGRGISIGKQPPPALLIDVEALPEAPEGSDADRIAKGLPPLGQDEDLSEEEIRKRREALGLPPPAFEKKPD
ncbi:MAG: hypothetical protein AAFR64_06230 [Pseudomonadota bacterium]